MPNKKIIEDQPGPLVADISLWRDYEREYEGEHMMLQSYLSQGLLDVIAFPSW